MHISANHRATISPDSLAEELRVAIGQAIVANRLPAGLVVSAQVDPWGMFPTFTVVVTHCPVPVVDGAAVLAKSARTDRLNKTGSVIKKSLETLARELLQGSSYYAAVLFSKSLLSAQVRWLRNLAPGQVIDNWAPSEDAATSSPVNINPYAALADMLRPLLAGGVSPSSADLFRLADQAFGRSQAAGGYVAKDVSSGFS